MHEVTRQELTDLERDALQEILNIGFGRAAADLTEIIDLHVLLSVPYIAIIKADDLISYLHSELPDGSDLGMVSQVFYGRFSGSSFLIFPDGERRKLLSLFDDELPLDFTFEGSDILERESLMEIGNLIIGACIGKVAELLGDEVTYDPPRFFSHDQVLETIAHLAGSADSFAIVFKNVFGFDQYKVNGYQFMICRYQTMPWLKQAIKEFLAPYV